MFANIDEVLFLEESCKFTINPANADKLIFLRETYKQYFEGKSNVLISENQDILEACILERLKQPETNPFVLLVQTKQNIEYLKGKPWYDTPEIANLIESFRIMVQNYLMTILQYPDQFSPQRCISDREKEENQEILKLIARLFDIFDSIGFDSEILTQFIQNLEENFNENQLHSQIIQYSRKCIQKLHIYNDQVNYYIAIFQHYLNDLKTRELIISDIIARWNVKTDRGDILEKEFVLGPLFTISLLQENQYVRQRAHQSLSGRMTKRQFEILLKQYQQTSHNHVENLVILTKLCLSKSTFQQTIQFLKAVCFCNKLKTKEAYSHNRQLKMIQNVSSDGFILNLYDILLNLSNKISSRADDTYTKIDKNFWFTLPFENDQMLLFSSKPLIGQNLQIGNVSYLFFYTLKFVQIGIMPVLTRMKDLFKAIKEKKDLIQILNDHPQKSFIQAQIDAQDEEAHQLEVVIFNLGRIKDTIQLFDTFILLFKTWLNVDNWNNNQTQWQEQEILKYIPEFIINDIIDYVDFYMQNLEHFTENYFNHKNFTSFVELAIYFIHLPIATNKYLPGKFIEAIYYFTKVTKNQCYIYETFVNNDLVRENLLQGLINQYLAVGETGANNQFYAKFQYRFYINDLLFQLMSINVYQRQFITHMDSNSGHRLIKHMISDMNYGFEEIWTNYLETFIKKQQEQEIPNNNFEQRYNKQRELDMIKGQIQSNLQNMKSNLKLLVEFSYHIPKILMKEIFQEMILKMLNYYLDNFLSEKSKEKLDILKQIAQKEFKLANFLHQIGTFFANICEENKAVSIIVKDGRSYHIENFQKLEKIFRDNISGQQDKVEKLSRFIKNLQRKSEKKRFLESILEQTQIPDKYQDPIYGELIKDPVMLPQSKTIMDRKVIITALLEKKLDPFTLTPLDEKDLIPLPELKQEIDVWLNQIKKQRDLKVQEAEQNRMQTEIQFQQSQIFKFQDEEDDQNVFKGNRYEDD
ncbi:unnamed protein product [Paramecium sonneborni]|uniref:RING-type E3 ubiquitin transferase n=1 Tax=Paramecium sonneborni TaxID=65129 RepID=A0A8S1MCJ5_9CILI|nr:unnamed protein product [Paramecium sonneborni]